jgi:hypothetical protein
MKKKTALQEAIDKIQKVLDLSGLNQINEIDCNGYEFGLITPPKIKSKLCQ